MATCGEQLPRRNVKRFRGGLVFKAHRLLYHSTLGLRVTTKKRRPAVQIEGIETHDLLEGARPCLFFRYRPCTYPSILVNLSWHFLSSNPHTGIFFSSSLLLASLELSDTQVYEPYIRALLGTTGIEDLVAALRGKRRSPPVQTPKDTYNLES